MPFRSRLLFLLCISVLAQAVAPSNALCGPGGKSYKYRSYGALLANSSIDGDFNDSIVLVSSEGAADVPSISDSWGYGVFGGVQQIPLSGFGNQVDVGFTMRSMDAPGQLAPGGAYSARNWRFYGDVRPGFWFSLDVSNVQFGVMGILGVSLGSLSYDDAGTSDGVSTDSVSFIDVGFRYGAGLEARIGSAGTTQLVLGMSMVKTALSYGSVSIGTNSIDLEDSLDGSGADRVFTIGLAIPSGGR